MKKLHSIITVILCTIIFLVIETIACVLALAYEITTNQEYVDRLLPVLENMDYSNQEMVSEYLGLCYEIAPLTIFITSLICLIPIFIYTRRKKIDLVKKISIKDGIQLYVIAVVLNIIISGIVELLPKQLVDNYNASVGYIDNLSFIPLLLAMGICAPIIEEIFFRFLMVKRLKDKPILAIVFPALMFGIAHGNIVQGSYAFLLGMLFAYLYIKTDNLTIPILLHIGINSSSVILTSIPLPLAIVFVILCFILAGYMLWKNKDFLDKKITKENLFKLKTT